MKKVLSLCLSVLFLLSIVGCSGEKRDIACDQVIAVYKDAGYEVFHKEANDGELDYVCYVRATDPESGEYIFFYFFGSEEAAESYADTAQWNIVLWLYSVASGQPTWVTAKTYGNIVIEYDDDELYKPFQTLLK